MSDENHSPEPSDAGLHEADFGDDQLLPLGEDGLFALGSELNEQLVLALRFRDHAVLVVLHGEIVARLQVARIELERSRQQFKTLLTPAGAAVDGAQVVQGVGIVRLDLQGLLELGRGFGYAARLFERVTQVVVRARLAGRFGHDVAIEGHLCLIDRRADEARRREEQDDQRERDRSFRIHMSYS